MASTILGPRLAAFITVALMAAISPAYADAQRLEAAVRSGFQEKPVLNKLLSEIPEGERPALVTTLTADLESPQWNQRANAAYVLGCIGSKAAPACPALIKAMDIQMENVAWEVIAALAKIGKPAVPPLIAELKGCQHLSDNLNHRALHAIAAVQALGPKAKDVAPLVVPYLKDGDNWGSVKALIAIGPDCIAAVCQGLNEPDRRIPIYAARVLSKLQPGASRQLAAFMSKANPAGRRNAAYVFAHLTPPPGVDAAPALCALLSDSDTNTVANAVAALKAMGPAAVPDVSEYVSSSNALVREKATEILRSYGTAAKPTTEALVQKLSSGDTEKDALLAATILAGDPANSKALKLLTGLLAGSEAKDRSLALRSFIKAGPGAIRAVPQITRALKDADVDNRIAAADALGEIGPGARSAVPALTTALCVKHPPHDYGRELISCDDTVYSAVIKALGDIGSQASSAVPQLVMMLKNDNMSRNEQIYKTLGQMGPSAAQAVPALTKQLLVSNPQSVIETLVRIGSPARSALPQLNKLLNDKDGTTRQQAYAAIMILETDTGKKQQIARRFLLDRDLGELARKTLSESKHTDAESVKVLLADFQARDSVDLRIVDTIKALGNAGPLAADALPKLIKDNTGSSYSQPVREAAFNAVKQIDPTGARTIPLVQPQLNDPFRVRASVELLERIGSPQCMELANATRTRWKLKH